jgi:hypothetical protein
MKPSFVKYFAFVFSILILLSCGQEEEYVIPNNVLQKEEIIPVIVDLQILESHFQRQFGRVDLFKDALDSSSQSIFDDYGITQEKYEESLQFYAETPDTLYVIYEAALDTVNLRLNQMNTVPEEDTSRSIIHFEESMNRLNEKMRD